MFKYVAKPTLVEAVQYHSNMGTETVCTPSWMIQLVLDEKIRVQSGRNTLHGRYLEDSDWIVKRGEEYFVMSDEQFQTYYEQS